jgi:hypothetical protein
MEVRARASARLLGIARLSAVVAGACTIYTVRKARRSLAGRQPDSHFRWPKVVNAAAQPRFRPAAPRAVVLAATGIAIAATSGHGQPRLQLAGMPVLRFVGRR